MTKQRAAKRLKNAAAKDKHFIVSWRIDVWAKDEREAAQMALKSQRETGSIAVVFDVKSRGGRPVRVDLVEDA